jgi:hypothetical protein
VVKRRDPFVVAPFGLGTDVPDDESAQKTAQGWDQDYLPNDWRPQLTSGEERGLARGSWPLPTSRQLSRVSYGVDRQVEKYRQPAGQKAHDETKAHPARHGAEFEVACQRCQVGKVG